MDAVVVHSEHGAGRLRSDFGVPADRVRVIPHGAFDYLTRQDDEQPLPAELQAVEGPVILAFGLIRPYKGTDVLLRAFSRIEEASSGSSACPGCRWTSCARWRIGRPAGSASSIDSSPIREIPAFMRRADLVVLPYRNIEQSGVLYTALAFGRPLVLSCGGRLLRDRRARCGRASCRPRIPRPSPTRSRS